MKKAKILRSLLVIGVLVFGLTACKSAGQNKPADTPDTGETTVETVIFSPSEPPTLVLGEGLDEKAADAIGTAYYKLTGKDIAIASHDSPPASHEIIVGKTERDISLKAYRVLELMRENEEYRGYAVYSDGKSAAIAFDEALYGVDVAYNEAMDRFVSEYMTGATLKLESGTVCYDLFDPFERQEERDRVYDDFLWERNKSKIAEALGSDSEAEIIVKKLREIKDMYGLDFDIVKWLANLYDQDTGAFYYSNSARNYNGYLPDILSTDKALDMVEAMFGNEGVTLSELLGEEAVSKLVAYTKSMQREDGYFYHPQWTDGLTVITPERISADVISALNTLGRFGVSPTYDVNGVKGDGTAVPVSSIAMPLTESTAKAVSLVLNSSTAKEVYIPAYLSSEKQFLEYLEGLQINSRTSNACKTIYENLPQYRAIDKYNEENGISYRLCDILVEYMSSEQSGNGLWTSGSVNSAEVIELIDVVNLYNALATPVPMYNYMFDTIAVVLTFGEGVSDLNEIADAWAGLVAVINNVKTYSDESDRDYFDNAMKTLYFGINAALNGTQKAISGYIRSYHSFSQTAGEGDPTHLGMSVAEINTDEGNIIATAIAATEIYPALFEALDLEEVSLFSTADRMVFCDTLADLGVLVKSDAASKFNYVKFEEYELGVFEDVKDLKLEKYIGSDNTYYEIVEDTVASTRETSNVLKWYAGADKNLDQIVIERNNKGYLGENGAYFEGDIKLEALLDKETRVSFYLRSSKMGHQVAYHLDILFSPDSKTFTLSSADFKETVDVGEGEWFKLRLEYADAAYDYDYDGLNDMVYKVYVNGKYIVQGHTPKDKNNVIPGTIIDDVGIRAHKNNGTCFYLDNLAVGQCFVTYDAPPDADTDTVTYEPGFLTDVTKPVLGSTSSSAWVKSMDVYGSVSKALQFYSAKSSADELIVSPTVTNEMANAITFETDIKIDPVSDTAVIYLEPRLSSGAIPFRLIIKAYKNGTVTVSSADISETVIGNSGEWIHIKVEYMCPRIDYTGDGVDDILYKVYVNNSVQSAAIGYTPYTFGAYYTPINLPNYALVVESDSEATVCLDNTRFWQEMLTPDTAPEFENSGDGTLSGPDGDKTDMNGWT